MDPEILTPRFLPCRAMCPYPCAFSLHFCLLGVMEMLWKGDARHGRCVVQVSQPVPPPRVVTPATPYTNSDSTSWCLQLVGGKAVKTRGHRLAFPRAGVWAGMGPILEMLPRLLHSPRAPWLGAHPKSHCPGSCCLDCPEEGAACPGEQFCDSCSYIGGKTS